MYKRALGDSSLAVSPLIFGAWAIGGWMWGGTDETAALEAIQASIDGGVTTIDTAAVYGMGYSEELVGRAVKGRRHDVQIATKCGLRWDTEQGEAFFTSYDNAGKQVQLHKLSSPASIVAECEASLKRLGTDYIDLYQIHWPDASTPIEDAWRAMLQLLAAGKVRAIGVSNYSLEQQQLAASIYPVASNQLPYSAVRRGIERDIVPYCQKHSVAVIAYSPLERGLLTGTVTTDRVFAPGDHRRDNPAFRPASRKRFLEACAEVLPLAKNYDLSVAQLILNWTMQQSGITAAIAGARNAEQARHNAAALQVTVDPETLARVQAIFQPMQLD